MLRTVHCLPLAFLFLVFVLPSNAQKEATIETSLSVEAGAPLKIECPVRPEQHVEWRLNSGEVPSDTRAAGETPAGDGRLVATLRAPAARAHHAGLYTCSRDRRRAIRLTVTGNASSQRPTPLAPVVAGEANVAAEAVDESRASDDGTPLVVFEVKGNITLACPLFDRDTKDGIVWKKNGTALEDIPELKDRFRLEGNVFNIAKRAQEDDFGNYSCATEGASHSWRVHARPHAKLPANANVVEGQALKLVCKVVGKPYPRVRWSFANASDEGAGQPLEAGARDGRVKLLRSEQGVEDAELQLEGALRSDAGRYRCSVGPSSYTGSEADTVLRVKDMYAALWPFLGICAEVFILCAIILVYEKRRTKPELDDSDTDNHDQKKS